MDIADGDFAGAAVLLSVEGDLLTLVEAAHAGALEGRGVDEHVLAAVVHMLSDPRRHRLQRRRRHWASPNLTSRSVLRRPQRAEKRRRHRLL